MSSLDSNIQERAAAKCEAVGRIEQFLAKIEAEKREPDRWEATYIERSLKLLQFGAYEGVEVEIEYASEPVNRRNLALKLVGAQELDRLHLETIRREITAAKAQPIEPFPPRWPHRLVSSIHASLPRAVRR